MVKILFAVIFVLLIIYPSKVLAVSLNIFNVPTTLDEQPFQFNVSLSGAQSGINYLRANLYTLGTTNYFGYTFNGNYYYNDSDFVNYLPINVDSSGNWNGLVVAKLDKNSPYFKGSGSYNLKLRRYTGSGSYIWSNEVSLIINLPLSSTPTPIPSSTSSPTNNQSDTSNSQTSYSFFNISNVLPTLNSDQILVGNINLSLPSNPNSNFYLKGAFVKNGGSNYFGLTKVNSNWIKNSESYGNQMLISTDSSGNFKGNIEAMVDLNDSGFSGSGDYIFKVARYSELGSGPVWSNQINVYINNVAIPTSAPSVFIKSILKPSTSHEIINNTLPKTLTNLQQSNKPLNTPKPSSTFSLPQDLLSTNLNNVASRAGITSTSFDIPAQVLVRANLTPNYLYMVGGLTILIFSGGVIMFILKKYTKKGYDLQK